jgi:hypothetical protein
MSSAVAAPQVGSHRAARVPTLAIGTVAEAAARDGRAPASLYRAAAIWAFVLLAAALRAYGLARQSAWADETTTLRIADPSLSFAQFWNAVLSEAFYWAFAAWRDAADGAKGNDCVPRS